MICLLTKVQPPHRYRGLKFILGWFSWWYNFYLYVDCMFSVVGLDQAIDVKKIPRYYIVYFLVP